LLNPEKIWHEHLTDLSTSPVRCSQFSLGNPKKSLICSALLFIYFRLFTLLQKKTNSNCCTAALAFYLLLFSASYYLHNPSTASAWQWWFSRVAQRNRLEINAAWRSSCSSWPLRFCWLRRHITRLDRDIRSVWNTNILPLYGVYMERAVTIDPCKQTSNWWADM